MAECFWADVKLDTVERVAEQIRRSAAELTAAGTPVELTDAILVPDDDVVLYLFTGPPTTVRQVCERAGVPFERIVESRRTRPNPQS
jgi:hypothetical protein